MEVQLSRGLVAVIDDEDAPLIAGRLWHASSGGRVVYAVDQSGQPMHRVLLSPAPDEVVDHIDGDGLNNRRSNIRTCTQAQNARNRQAQEHSSTFKGVFAKGKNWAVCIRHENETIHLGTFEQEEAAARQYDRAARVLFGQFARTNEMLGLLPPRKRAA